MPQIDPIKLTHWLNARKLTVAELASRARSSPAELNALLARSAQAGAISSAFLSDVAECLAVDATQLLRAPALREVLMATAAQIAATCRRIRREGVDMYDYYTMPGRHGAVQPVILDILWPAGSPPPLNRGHLEPAITVLLRQSDIWGRWGEALCEPWWSRLSTNRDDTSSFIQGDTYIEPSYRPHAYGRADQGVGRIISYTCRSRLDGFVAEMNGWSETMFSRLLADCDGAPSLPLLHFALELRGHSCESLAARLALPLEAVRAFCAGSGDALSLPAIRRVAGELGLDYRSLLAAPESGDGAGKVLMRAADSVAARRRHGRYEVAPMASSPQLPDICGVFLRVAEPSEAELDACFAVGVHYYVTEGQGSIIWQSPAEPRQSRLIAVGDAIWVEPFVKHALAGHASLVRLSGGCGVAELEPLEATSSRDWPELLRRARHDRQSWGYDPEA